MKDEFWHLNETTTTTTTTTKTEAITKNIPDFAKQNNY